MDVVVVVVAAAVVVVLVAVTLAQCLAGPVSAAALCCGPAWWEVFSDVLAGDV